MKKLLGGCVTALVLAAASSTVLAQQVKKFPVIQLTAGMNVIHAEMAASEAEREQGLMFRESMGTNEGMVFLFGAPASVCMWMNNALIPLSVAFIDRDGRIVNIEDMKPQTLDSHCSKGQVFYALEMNAGWFKHRNIKAGSIINGLPPVHGSSAAKENLAPMQTSGRDFHAIAPPGAIGNFLGQCLHGSCQTTLVASGLVLVDDLLVGDTIDRRDGS